MNSTRCPGIGVLGSTALAATLGDAKAWRSGREFSASMGLVPAHAGTGGKVRMGHLSKRGDPYLRTLLIHGARSLVEQAKHKPKWLEQLLARRPLNVAVVALANKTARTAWALEPMAGRISGIGRVPSPGAVLRKWRPHRATNP